MPCQHRAARLSLFFYFMKILKKQSYRSVGKNLNDNNDKIMIMLELDIREGEWYKFLANNRMNLDNWKEFINKE